MAIIDVTSYNGEEDLLEIRLNILGDFVDQFIVVECPTTFCGTPKPIYFEQQKERFTKWLPKIKHFVVDENYSDEEVEQARKSHFTNGEPRWMHEFLQKESIRKAMIHLKDDDICFLGDVDEIYQKDSPIGFKLKLRVYTYFLNYRSNEEFWGPICFPYGYLKDKCFNELRNTAPRTDDFQGWHFTNQGGFEAVKKKIDDQYNKDIFNFDTAKMLPNRFGKFDYIGRNFTFKVDESEWPQFLKDNREKYDRLLYRSDK